MHTFQIAKPVLDDYRNNKLSTQRIDFLIKQAQDQLNELSQNEKLYNSFLEKINPPKNVDKIILWMLIMSNDDMCSDYSDEFNKNYRPIIPVSDLADLLLYIVHLKQVENVDLDGFDFLLDYEYGGIDEMDQYCFTNVLLHVQKSKEVQMEF